MSSLYGNLLLIFFSYKTVAEILFRYIDFDKGKRDRKYI